LTIEPKSEVSMVVENDHTLALYVAMGSVEVGEATVPARSIAPLSGESASLVLRSKEGARALLFGGAPMADPTVIWWNFVVGSVAEGRELQAEWEAGRFPAIPEQMRGGP
jgi:quercetin 2,3-dioxygenase